MAHDRLRQRSGRFQHIGAGTASAMLLLAIGIALSLQFLIVLFDSTWHELDRHSDFVDYYVAGLLVRQGDSPYDVNKHLALRAKVISQVPDEGMDVSYLYPPPFVLLFLPFTLLPIREANFLWISFQATVVATCCGYLLTRSLSGWARFLIPIYALAWLPVVVCLKFGQVSLLLLLSFLAGTSMLVRNRQILGGLFLSFLWIKPTLVGAPLILLTLHKQWKAILVMCGSMLLLFAVTRLAFGSAMLSEYEDVLRRSLELQASNASWKSSTYSLAALTSEGPSGLTILFVLDILVLGIWLWILKVRSWGDTLSTMPIVATLMSPHLFVYDITLALAAAPSVMRRRSRFAPVLLIGGFAITWIAHLWVREPRLVTLWLLLLLLLILAYPENGGLHEPSQTKPVHRKAANEQSRRLQ